MAQKKENKKENKKNKKASHFAWACWLLVLILILLIFLVKKDTIITNLKNTSFFDRVFGSTPEFVEKHEGKEKKSKNIAEDIVVEEKSKDEVINLSIPGSNKTITMNDLKKSISSSIENKTLEEEKDEISEINTDNISENNKTEQPFIESKSAPDEKSDSETKTSTPNEKKVTPKETVAPATVEVRKSEVNLCFVLIDSEGRVSRKEIKRTVNKNDSPLTSAINLLLQGPLVTNSNEKDCITLIPEGTRLLSAKVSNGVAFLDFSDEFEFNTYGVEGYKHQLEQIVFTATSFSTVKSVQFLIEGEKEDYLGSEGMWIGSPLSRSSF